MHEFVINEYITLKLEDNETNLYVGGEKIHQCKYLLMNIDSSKPYEKIHSIDDLKNYLDTSLELESEDYNISPETEFWGHCSNIQVWVEEGYDIRFIHSNLAIPILRKLLRIIPEQERFRIYERCIEVIEKLCQRHPHRRTPE